MEAATRQGTLKSVWKNPGFRTLFGMLIGLDVLYWVIGPKAGSGSQELYSLYLAGGVTVLWLFSLVCLALCLLGRGLRGWWRRRHNLGPLAPQNPAVAAIIAAGVVVPLNAFAVHHWVSWRNQRSLSCARSHAEVLVGELEEFHGREGRYPERIDALPSGNSLPDFAGCFFYDGGGPSRLRLQEELPTLSGGILEWSFDAKTGAWTSVRHDF